MRVPDENARTFYAEECVKFAWSVRQLERQNHTMYYRRILASQDKEAVFTYLPTEEKMKRELRLGDFHEREE